MRTRRKRSDTLLDVPPREVWPSPDIDRDVKDKEGYAARKLAVDLWLAGHTEKSIHRATRLTVSDARRLVQRAASINPRTNNVVGYWACVPGFRAQQGHRVRRTAFNQEYVDRGRGLTGVLDQFFRNHPDIEQEMCLFVRRRRTTDAAPAALVTPGMVHSAFIALCRKKGLHKGGAWPFNTKRAGYGALREWYHRERYKNPVSAVYNAAGEVAGDLAKLDHRALHAPRDGVPWLAYERVELDEHHLDAIVRIFYPTRGGRFADAGAARPWGLAMVDCGSNVILGSAVSYRQRYDRNDVLRLIQNSLHVPPRKKLPPGSANLCYADEAAFPGELPEFRGNLWQTLAMDRDVAHFSPQQLRTIQDVTGCIVSGELLGNAVGRPIVEALFLTAANAARWLPSATGNKPDSAARRDAVHGAEQWCIVAPLLEQLFDVLCRNHNSTPSARCHGLSPLQLLNEMMQRGEFYRCPVGELRQSNLWRLLPVHAASLSQSRGKGPLGVNLFGGRYSSPELARDPELLCSMNKACRVYVQEDARFAFVVPEALPQKVFPVVVTGTWVRTPHNLEWRRISVNFAKNAAMAGKASSPQVMHGVLELLGQAAKTDNAAAVILSSTVGFMNRFGGGETSLISTPDGIQESLVNWAHKIVDEDEDLTVAADAAEDPFGFRKE